jgi:hypothetical protein
MLSLARLVGEGIHCYKHINIYSMGKYKVFGVKLGGVYTRTNL